MLGQILVFSFVGSILSLFGGILLAVRKKPFSHAQSLLLISFSAGVLLSTAFFDLLPEALEMAEGLNFGWILAGVVFLFVLEKFLLWYHHHDHEHAEQGFTGTMIMVGDTVHNFVDGVVIAAATMVNPSAGLVTALAVGAHEIPHELADFGVLLAKGWSKKRVIVANLVSASSAILGAVLMFMFGQTVEGALPVILMFTAGMFIYLACSDLIPELHHEHGKKDLGADIKQMIIFGLGVGVVWVLIKLLEG